VIHPDCTCRDCKPGGVSHHWALRMGPREEARCWCQPFLWPDAGCIEADGEFVSGVLHRPSISYGYVFWGLGEEGPQSPDAAEHIATFDQACTEAIAAEGLMLTDPVLDDLDGIRPLETWSYAKIRELYPKKPFGCTAEGE
jgi:hypothetical protein